MRSVPIRKTTPTPVPERAEREQRTTRRSPFRCMGTGTDGYIRRMPILRALHRRLLQAHLDLPNAAKERSVQTLPNIQEGSRKGHWSTCSMPSIRSRQGVFLRRLHDVYPKGRTSARIHLPTHSTTKRCSRAQKSAPPRSSTGHDEREAHAQVLLGRSCAYGRLPNEPVYNIRSARGHAT